MNIYREYKNVNAVAIKMEEEYIIYDSYSNKVFSVPEIFAVILDDYYKLEINELISKYSSQYDKNDIKESVTEINSLINNQKCLRKFCIKEFSVYEKEKREQRIRKKLDNDLIQLLFNVTEKCNLNCQYCIYSGQFEGNRKHNSKHELTWGVAKKSIDFFLQRSKNSDERFITFYGGEPLLRFKLINKIIKYSKTICDKISFSMTTNGTMLTPEIIDFLIFNKVSLTISLDGPKSVHDKYRLTKNGKGTFFEIINNLNYIESNHPHYYRNTLKINSVISPCSEYSRKINDFFTYDRFPSTQLNERHTFAVANPSKEFTQDTNYDKFIVDYHYQLGIELRKVHRKEVGSMKDLPPFIRGSRVLKQMHFFHQRQDIALDDLESFWPNGICVPGQRTLFVSCEGDFYPCEKMYDKKYMKIGDLQSGFDINKILDYMDEYIETISPLCRKCWAVRFCGECYISATGKGEFSPKERKKHCDGIKAGWMEAILQYSIINARNSDSFKYFDFKNDESFEVMNNMYD